MIVDFSHDDIFNDKIRSLPKDNISIIISYIRYQPQTNEELKKAVEIWCEDNEYALDKYWHISLWDVSKITNMAELFRFKSRFNDDISRWDTSNVTDMSYMFHAAHSFNQPIGNWNVSNVTNMCRMFWYAHAFNQPIGNWDVSNVTNMFSLFCLTRSFNQPIGNWNVSNVRNMACMFAEALAFNQPIGNWDVSNVIDMDLMFGRAMAFDQSLENWNWNIENTTDIYHMFYDSMLYMRYSFRICARIGLKINRSIADRPRKRAKIA